MSDIIVQYFDWKVRKGMDARGLSGKEEYEHRLKEELPIIHKMGYEAYLLVVADLIAWARAQRIPVGPGRGSAAGCLISYCLAITNVDPIKYKLLFERFLNPDRVSMPDIDIDFCKERVEEVVNYVREKYGEDHVARIKTFGKLFAKSAIRDIGRVAELDPLKVAEAAEQVERVITQDDQKLERLYVSQPHLKSWRDGEHGELGAYLFQTAEKLEGLVRTSGMHAAGVVIGDEPLVRYMGLDLNPATQEPVTCFDMGDCERLGLIKFDLLSLDTLTQIQLCIDMVHENHGIKIDIDSIPEDDDKVWELMDEGRLGGVFQMSGEGFTRLTKLIRARSIEDLAMISSIYRPGPMGAGIHEKIIKARDKGIDIYDHESKEVQDVLNPTSGAIVYQEQCMRIARHCAGYTPGETDNLRKIIGKKLIAKMEAEKPKFVEGMVKNGASKEYAEWLWKEMERFGAYGFNKSHAISYAILSYQTAYLKSHYPAEFLAASLSMKMDPQKRDTLLALMYECKDANIPIVSPCVNRSRDIFWAQDDRVLYGLAAIKGIGSRTIEHIMEVRQRGEFTSIQDFVERCHGTVIDTGTLDILAKCGAFDSIEPDRALAIEKVRQFNLAFREKKRREIQKDVKLQRNLSKFADKGKARGYKSVEALRQKVSQELIEIQGWYDAEAVRINKLEASLEAHDILNYEVDLLGFYMKGHPLDQCAWVTKKYSIAKAMEKVDDTVEIVGVVTDIKKFRTKAKQEPMAVFILEDKQDKVKCVLFPKSFGVYGNFLEDNSVVYVSGKRGTGEIYVDEIRDTATMLKKGVSGAIINAPISSGTISRVKYFLTEQEDGKIPLILKLQGAKGAVELEAGKPVREFIRTEMEAKKAGLDFEWRK